MAADQEFTRFHDRQLAGLRLAQREAVGRVERSPSRHRGRRTVVAVAVAFAAFSGGAYAYTHGGLPSRDSQTYISSHADKLAELRQAERLVPPPAPGYTFAPIDISDHDVYQAGVATEAVLGRRQCSWDMSLLDASRTHHAFAARRALSMLARPIWYRYDDDAGRAFERRLLSRAKAGDVAGVAQFVKANCVGIVKRATR